MHELAKSGSDMVLQQAALVGAQVAAEHARQQAAADEQRREEEFVRKAAELERLEAQIHDDQRRVVKTRDIKRGDYAFDLVSRACYRAVEFGVPAVALPVFVGDREILKSLDKPPMAGYDSEYVEILLDMDSNQFKKRENYTISGALLPGAPDFYVSDDELHPLLHETGHRMNHWAMGTSYHDRVFDTYPGFAEIAKRVSGCAAKSHREMVAEVFCGMALGKTFDADVMKMYSYFKGWLPPKKITADPPPSLEANLQKALRRADAEEQFLSGVADALKDFNRKV